MSIFLTIHVSRLTKKSELKNVIPVQSVLELQRLQALPAQTVNVFSFNKCTFLIAQLYLAALALSYITHLTFKGEGTPGTFFGFVCRHDHQLKVIPALNRVGMPLYPLISENFRLARFCTSPNSFHLSPNVYSA
jgi:hypothetical protein